MVFLDLDKILVKKVSQTSKSFLGRHLLAFAERIGGASSAAIANIILTASLGFIITFPLYELEGLWLALPTGAFTLFLMLFIALAILSNYFNIGRAHARKLLVFAILLSLPFGILSISLLNELSKKRE